MSKRIERTAKHDQLGGFAPVTISKRAMPILALALVSAIALPSCTTSNMSESTSSVDRPNSTTTPSAQTSLEEPSDQGMPLLTITVNGTTFFASFESNSSAEAFVDLLQQGPQTLSLHDYGGFEKVGPLGTNLPTNDVQVTTQPGDVILYQGNQITIYYDTNTWSFTRIAHIDASRDDLLTAFGEGDVEATFDLRWDTDAE